MSFRTKNEEESQKQKISEISQSLKKAHFEKTLEAIYSFSAIFLT